MTFKESMTYTLVGMGMFDSHADQVIKEYMEDESAESMIGRWDHDMKDYPQNIQSVVWIGVKHFASEWIERNMPQAWYKPMFKPDFQTN